MIEAVVFDLDGVLVESEEDWELARRDLVSELAGGVWSEEDQRSVLGTNLRQCAAIINARHRTGLPDEEVGRRLVGRRMEMYGERLVELPGAAETVRALAATHPVAIASSSPPEIIRFVVERLGIADRFSAIASSDEVERGKPEPDVYLLACERLGVDPARALAFEDSDPGIRAAANAGMRVAALPSPAYPPRPETLALADLVLGSLAEFDRGWLADPVGRAAGGTEQGR